MLSRCKFCCLYGLLAMLLCLAARSVPAQRAAEGLPKPFGVDTLGVNIHFTDPKPGEMEQLAQAGFHWIRMDFAWAGIERQQGVYDFAAYDRLLSKLKQFHLRAIFILDYGNDLYEKGSPRIPEARAAFARFAAAAVTHFKGNGILWEMWNEPNGGFWTPVANVNEYIALALETGKAIRQAAPNELYIGPATSGMDFVFLEKCFQAGLLQYWDAVSFHPYRDSPPETAIPDFDHVRDLISRYAPKGKEIPILSGEWGYSELYPGLDLEKQSKYISREFLTNLSSGLIVSIWYDWHDDGVDPKDPEAHFGAVYVDYKPKPTYRAAQTLTQLLTGYRYDKRLALPSDRSSEDYCLLFRDGEKVRLAAWTTDPKPQEVTIPASAGEFQIVGYTGERSKAVAGKEGLHFTLTDAPQYLIPVGNNRLLTLAAQWHPLPARIVADNTPEALTALASVLHGDWPSSEAGHLTLALQSGTQNVDLPIKSHTALPAFFTWQRHSSAETPFRATLTVAGAGAVSQETSLTSRHPITLSPCPAQGKSLMVRVLNPSGMALSGTVRLVTGAAPGAASGQELASDSPQPVSFAAGETEKRVTLPLVQPAGPTYTLALDLQEQDASDKQGSHLTTQPITYRSLDWFDEYASGAQPPVSDYALVPDGDPAVKSQLDWSVVPAPPGIPGYSGNALRIDYDFDKGWKFLRVAPQGVKRDIGTAKQLGLWVYGDGSENILNMRFTDQTGQTFQPSAGPIQWKGWRYVTFDLGSANAGHWGGANDGVVHGPLRIDTTALVDSYDRRGGKGEIYITGITLTSGPGL